MRSNQSILKEINTEYSLEGLMLELKLQYFGLLIQRVNSLEKTPKLEKTEGRRRGWQRMRWLDGITGWMDMSEQTLGDGEGQGSLVCCSPWGQTGLSKWETTTKFNYLQLIVWLLLLKITKTRSINLYHPKPKSLELSSVYISSSVDHTYFL